jgi:tryptophanyl-tRNA synthetase
LGIWGVKDPRAERAKWEADIDAVYDILLEGTLKARETTNRTLERVRKAMRIDYFDDRRIVKEWEALLKEAQPRGRR